MKAVEDFPFTLILGLAGALIGFMLPSGLEYYSNSNWFNVSDPVGTITAAVIGLPLLTFIHIISGLIGGLIMGIVGLIIDGVRGASSYY